MVKALRSTMVLAALALIGCPSTPPSQTPAKSDPLAVEYDRASFKDSPKLSERLSRSAFHYFRYTNRPFVDVVCERWADAISKMPTVNLHGDAHLEQYAVSADGRGLADFDAAALGPPIVDLARFATSLHLAAKTEADAKTAIEAFLRGYTTGLTDPSARDPEPAAAARLHAKFAPTAVEWLETTQRLMEPVDPKEQPALDKSWAIFTRSMLEQNPSLDPAFFTIKVGGRLSGGIGSAHAEKFLVRVEGPTPKPEDDLIMEAKEMMKGALGRCVRGADLDAMRVIVGQARLSTGPQRFLGMATIHGKSFYAHTWQVHYRELSVGDVASPTELAEIAHDVGLQLGRGHPKAIADPLGAELRRSLERMLADVAPTLPARSKELADRVRRGWEAFRVHAQQR